MPKLIDTNVLIAASARNPLSNVAGIASPPEPELREQVFQWLIAFADSDHQIVLDLEGYIRSEYEANLGYSTALRDQEYGLLLLQDLEQNQRINYVTIESDPEEGAARLPAHLAVIVTDRADRKWVASALAHSQLYDGVFPPIVYAAESDWYVIEDALGREGYLFERLLPDDWYNNHCKR
jgi:hypothetical protein